MAKKTTVVEEKPEKLTDAKKLKAVIEKIDKDFGKGAIMMLGEKEVFEDNIVSTSSIGLDHALGIGGLPYGRIVEIYGPESSGKTTLAIHVIANVQKAGGRALLIDAEHAFDKDYAQSLGVNVDELYINQPDYAEQGLEVVDRFVDSGLINVIVVDSVAALVPKAELEGEMGESKMGLMARLMSQALRKLTGKISKTGTLVIFINQLRDKIGIMFGNPETTTGGNALKFYASVRIDVRRISQIKDGDEVIANRTKLKVVKNKLAPPFKQVEVDIVFGQGIDTMSEVIDLGIITGAIGKSGSWYNYGDEKLGQGRDSVKQLFQDNLPFYEEVKADVENRLKQQ